MEVKNIGPLDTINIRKQMLRKDFPLDACHYPGDDDDLTFHLGGLIDGKLVSVASFYFVDHPSIEEGVQYQLRGMATLPDFQGQGLSSALLRTAFPIIKQNQGTTLWCNAREKAWGFYEKVGFKKRGEAFEIENIGKEVL